MKKTTQINIGGRHFHINEDAFASLTHYINALKSHFSKEGEAGKEIVEDIEQRIAELLGDKMIEGKEVIVLQDIEEVIGVLGKVEDFEYEAETVSEPKSEKQDRYYERGESRRLYRDTENGYIGGVAAGLGAYFVINPLWIRLAFILLVFVNLTLPGFIFKGAGVLIYIIIWIVVPRARTTTEKLRMHGRPVNLSTIKESVNTEFDKVRSGFSNFKDSDTARSARNAMEEFARIVGLIFIAFFKFLIGFIGVALLVVGALFLAGLITTLIGFTGFFGISDNVVFWDNFFPFHMAESFASPAHYYLFVVSLVVIVIIPVIALIYGGIKILFNIKTKHKVFRIFMLTTWILALVLFISFMFTEFSKFAVEASDTSSKSLMPYKGRMHIAINDNTENKRITEYHVFDNRFFFSKWDDAYYEQPKLVLTMSEDDKIHISVNKSTWNLALDNSSDYFDEIQYDWYQSDSILYLDKYFETDEEDFWMFPEVDVVIQIPENQVFTVSKEICNMLKYQRYLCKDSLASGRPAIMTDGKLKVYHQQ